MMEATQLDAVKFNNLKNLLKTTSCTTDRIPSTRMTSKYSVYSLKNNDLVT